MVDPLRVNLIKAHHNWILIAYPHLVTCHKFKDAGGWQLVFTSPHMEHTIDRAALNARMNSSGSQSQSSSVETKMIALASGAVIRLWAITDEGQRTDIGNFHSLSSICVRTTVIFLLNVQVHSTCTFRWNHFSLLEANWWPFHVLQ